MQRRDLIKTLLFAPLLVLLPKLSFAAGKKKDDPKPANALPENDPMGGALKYKEDATKAPERSDKTAFCHSCAKFDKCNTADTACKPAPKDATYKPCELFSGKVVHKNGWCLSWQKKV